LFVLQCMSLSKPLLVLSNFNKKIKIITISKINKKHNNAWTVCTVILTFKSRA